VNLERAASFASVRSSPFGGSGMDAWQRTLSTSSLYGAMFARVKAALQHPGAFLAGMSVYQGEEDGRTLSNGNA
jgi:hypothetical protein